MEPNNPNSKNDLNEEALRDLIADQSDEQQTSANSTTEKPVSPQSDLGGTPPPQDEVVQEPAAQSIAADSEVTDLSSEPEASAGQPVQTIAPDIPSPVSAHADDHIGKKTSKGLVVAIAVVLALVLAAIAILVFMKANKTTKNIEKTDSTTTSQANTPAPATQTTDKTPVTTNDVDTTVSDVDATLSALDENKDFSQDALSDKTLGLQ